MLKFNPSGNQKSGLSQLRFYLFESGFVGRDYHNLAVFCSQILLDIPDEIRFAGFDLNGDSFAVFSGNDINSA